MKNYEAFLKIREKISEDEGRIPALQDELILKQRAQAQLDEQARRSWALEEPGADKLKAAAEANEKAVVRLEEELKKLKLRVELMKKDSVPAQEAAIKDLQAHYRAAAEPLIKELVARLRGALEIETQLAALEDGANAKRCSVSPYPRIIIPFSFHFLLPYQGRFQNGPLGQFLSGLKQDGFDVGKDVQDAQRYV